MPREEIRSITLELPAYYVIFLAYSARLQNKPTCDGPHIFESNTHYFEAILLKTSVFQFESNLE